MKVTVADVISQLNRLPLDATVEVHTVWTNGKAFRLYQSQDKSPDTVLRTAERGYRKGRIVVLSDGGGDDV